MRTQKHGNSSSSYSSPPPNQGQQAAHSQQYGNKPAPPLPANHQPAGHRFSPTIQPPGNYGYGSTPPNHGYTSPPPGSFPNRPPSGSRSQQPISRPPPSPAPPNGADPALWPLFKAVDKDGENTVTLQIERVVLMQFLGSGFLTEKELRAALVNGDWSSFDAHTVKMMIRMFDTDRSGTIGFEEFCGLWGFLAAWRSLFDRFDTDRSGNISVDEYTNALVAFGYRLSSQFVDTLFMTYDKRNEGAISFDLFVQSCISLKRMTDVFKKYDDDRDGYITLSL